MQLFFRHYWLPKTRFDFNDRKSVTHYQGHYRHNASFLWYNPMMHSWLSYAFSSKLNRWSNYHELGKVLTYFHTQYWTSKRYCPMIQSKLNKKLQQKFHLSWLLWYNLSEIRKFWKISDILSMRYQIFSGIRLNQLSVMSLVCLACGLLG